jgi:hypothetical protein
VTRPLGLWRRRDGTGRKRSGAAGASEGPNPAEYRVHTTGDRGLAVGFSYTGAVAEMVAACIRATYACGTGSLAWLQTAHRELWHLASTYHEMNGGTLPPEPPEPRDLRELRNSLRPLLYRLRRTRAAALFVRGARRPAASWTTDQLDRLGPTDRNLLRYFAGRTRAAVEGLAHAVWHDDLVSDDAVKAAVRRVNHVLERTASPWRLRRRRGLVLRVRDG